MCEIHHDSGLESLVFTALVTVWSRSDLSSVFRVDQRCGQVRVSESFLKGMNVFGLLQPVSIWYVTLRR